MRLSSCLESAEQEVVPHTLQEWFEVCSFDCLILQALQVHQASAVKEGDSQNLLAPSWPSGFLRMVVLRS